MGTSVEIVLIDDGYEKIDPAWVTSLSSLGPEVHKSEESKQTAWYDVIGYLVSCLDFSNVM